MDDITPQQTESGAPSVAELLERRARVQAWLTRLDELGSDAESRIVERVRGDYEQRLASVMAQLAHHEDTLRVQREEFRERLQQAVDEQGAVSDALQEARLRNLIGELTDDEWADRRPALETRLADAERVRGDAEGELTRLEELLRQIEGHGAPREEQPAAPAEEPAPTLVAPPEPEESPDSFAVLGEVDLVTTDAGISAEPDTRPPPGIKCPDCGYMNDANAWYCGVCGVDLA
ncbi:MAG TPA: hypothetical protein VFL93_13560 [Longimicrobiaceae bacterium]|nr:hypothetical protein [Longimicrobiaceae bacterium]